jgi:hypothetical protein
MELRDVVGRLSVSRGGTVSFVIISTESPERIASSDDGYRPGFLLRILLRVRGFSTPRF